MKRIYALILTFLMLFSFSVFATEDSNGRIEIYVDVNAEVGGDGSINSPLKTIDEAQAKVRDLISSENYPKDGIVVFLREGTYMVSDTIKFGEEDSGKEGAPVVWRTYYNETVTISNGVQLSLSEFEYSEDERIPEEAQGKVLSYNLRENGLPGHDGLYLAGHSQHFYWAFDMAEEDAIQFGYPVPEVFFGNDIGTLAQYPNEGWLGITELVDRGTAQWWITDYNGTHLDSWVGTTVKVDVDKERMSRWANAKNPWFDAYWMYDWSDFRGPWESIDPVNKTMKMKHSSPYPPTVGSARWKIYNLIEELDAPGEWFYDEDNGQLYVFPTSGTRADEKITLCFQRKNIIELDNVHDIVFNGFNLTGTRFSGIVGENCERVEVAYCNVNKVSSDGISFSSSKDCYIHGNIVKNVGARGIMATGGSRDTLEPSGILVENNYIDNFARLQKSYIGGIAVQGVGVTVRNNSISNGPQSAITYGGNDHLIEKNDIHNVLKEASDMGAIYRYMDYAARGNIIRNNVFHDLTTDSGDSIGIYCIYFDGGSSGDTAEGNVFYNIDGSGVFMNTGSYHTVKNNIFSNVTGDGVYFACVMGRDTELNKSLDGAENYKDNPAYAKYPGFVEMFDDPDHWTTTKGCVVQDNIGYNVGGKVANYTLGASKMTYDLMQKYNNFEEGVLYKEDPGFLSLDNNNYTLTSASKVLSQIPSFKEENINMSEIGTLTGMLQHYLSDKSLVVKKDSKMSFVDFEKAKLLGTVKTIDEKDYIPLRFSYESMDYPVEWNGETKEITVSTKLLELSFKLDFKEYVKNGETKTLKNNIIFDNGITYISAEDFAEITELSLYTTDDGLYIFSEKNLSGVIYDDMLKDLNERLEM